ncbi:hypothetical protein CRE_28865 [Caenorhabditis remanei]|uniref:F-box associated domain-containing protein n=1 Tax=Caenorhabditis remanei TaxID=31234 RepID=E3MXJ6_CAERE|nr:hypothetical protein CRE_28865 [Caenorhabditis remanei]
MKQILPAIRSQMLSIKASIILSDKNKAVFWTRIGRKRCNILNFNTVYLYQTRNGSNWKTFEFGDSQVACGISWRHYPSLCLENFCSKQNFKTVIQNIYMYLCALFHSPKSKIQTHRLYECQCSKALKRSDNFWFYKNNWNLEKYGLVSPDDSVHNSTNLLILHTGYQISQFLTCFRGSYAVFLNAETQDSCVKKFLERWITQSFDMMSSVIVYQKPGWKFDEKAVLEGLRIEKHPNSRKYPYGSILQRQHKFAADTFDCSSGVDIRRPADGRRATIKLTPDYCMFFVWRH